MDRPNSSRTVVAFWIATAHLAVGDGPEAWGWAVGSGVLWALSYFLWRRIQTPVLTPVAGAVR
jgi:hypothetical protein